MSYFTRPSLYYCPQRSWGKVIFSEVCVKNSVYRERVSTPLHAGIHPQEQIPPKHPTSGSRHPPVQCMLGDTGNKRVVRILLECILVSSRFDVRWFSVICSRLRRIWRETDLAEPCGDARGDERDSVDRHWAALWVWRPGLQHVPGPAQVRRRGGRQLRRRRCVPIPEVSDSLNFFTTYLIRRSQFSQLRVWQISGRSGIFETGYGAPRLSRFPYNRSFWQRCKKCIWAK